MGLSRFHRVRVERSGLANSDAEGIELLDRAFGVLLMKEDTAGIFPKMCVPQLIVQNVAPLRMVSLVDRHDGEDAGAGKMLLRPPDLLRRGPSAARWAIASARLRLESLFELTRANGSYLSFNLDADSHFRGFY